MVFGIPWLGDVGRVMEMECWRKLEKFLRHSDVKKM